MLAGPSRYDRFTPVLGQSSAPHARLDERQQIRTAAPGSSDPPSAPCRPCKSQGSVKLHRSSSGKGVGAAEAGAPGGAGLLSEENIRVFVRVRPEVERERAAGHAPAVEVDVAAGTVRLLEVEHDKSWEFGFDGVLGEECSQEQTFDLVGRGLVESCLAGYNSSICLYGQTGAGKTYTMCGAMPSAAADDRSGGGWQSRGLSRGLAQRSLECAFEEIARRRAEGLDVQYTCYCSFLEIYREQISDLLESTAGWASASLQVREDATKGTYVDGLSQLPVASLAEAEQVFMKGLRQRQVAATHMNDRSSRSHALFKLSVERTGGGSASVAGLCLVDLAGAERQSSSAKSLHAGPPPRATQQDMLRVKEASANNKSLSTLSKVIALLSQGEKHGSRPHIPYRDSKLTFLLRESLGGTARSVIVANVSPAEECAAETLRTLRFAASAKNIKCQVITSEPIPTSMDGLVREVRTLRRKLASATASSALWRAHPPVAPATAEVASTLGETAVSADAASSLDEPSVLLSTPTSAPQSPVQPPHSSPSPAVEAALLALPLQAPLAPAQPDEGSSSSCSMTEGNDEDCKPLSQVCRGEIDDVATMTSSTSLQSSHSSLFAGFSPGETANAEMAGASEWDCNSPKGKALQAAASIDMPKVARSIAPALAPSLYDNCSNDVTCINGRHGNGGDSKGSLTTPLLASTDVISRSIVAPAAAMAHRVAEDREVAGQLFLARQRLLLLLAALVFPFLLFLVVYNHGSIAIVLYGTTSSAPSPSPPAPLVTHRLRSANIDSGSSRKITEKTHESSKNAAATAHVTPLPQHAESAEAAKPGLARATPKSASAPRERRVAAKVAQKKPETVKQVAAEIEKSMDKADQAAKRAAANRKQR
mmetsp:Transcript_51395/g.134927  ORF Transcript_51395/g.134927 Transcript_51395/m.134927 type:complete len:881 (+) Transcript_51395:138-2780(+)